MAGSGQGVKVHRGQWLPPVAEVAVFRVGQVCARATGHRGEEELNHLTQPLICGFVVLHGLLCELSPGIDCEDARFR